MKTSKALSEVAANEMTNLDDWQGLGDVIALSTSRLVAPVHGVHRAIADRWLGLVGPKIEPAAETYDALVTLTYDTIRMGGSALGAGISLGAGVAGRRWALPPLWQRPGGSYVQSVLNALWGDRFEDDESTFSIGLGIRDAEGAPVTPDAPSLGCAFPLPSSRLVVLLHGLGETERSWLGGGEPGLHEVLEADGFSVLFVRYNTGRSISANGIDLSNLLETVSKGWPVPVADIALVGHSMGGLVARSAVATARNAGKKWIGATHHLVAIASPHLGTPIEKAVDMVSRGLNQIDESRAIAAFVDERSAGIKDLRHGEIPGGEDHGRIKHHFVAGSVVNDPGHPLASLVGDLVVRVGSATGRGRRRQVNSTDAIVVGGRHHGALIQDVDVQAKVRGWLTAESPE